MLSFLGLMPYLEVFCALFPPFSALHFWTNNMTVQFSFSAAADQSDVLDCSQITQGHWSCS